MFSKKCTCQLIKGTCFLQVVQDTAEPVQKSPEEQAQGDHQHGSEAPEMSQNMVVQQRLVSPVFSSRQGRGTVPVGHPGLAKHWTIAASFASQSPGLNHALIS